MKRSKILALGLALALTAGLLAGCTGGSGSQSPSPTPSQTVHTQRRVIHEILIQTPRKTSLRGVFVSNH